MKSRVVTLLAVLLIPLPSAGLQDARYETHVRLSVEGDGTGFIESSFAAALRSLGDIRVVGPGEPSHLIVDVTVICVPSSCEDASAYAGSVRLLRGLNWATLSTALLNAGYVASEEVVRSGRFPVEILNHTIEALGPYQVQLIGWAFLWGREVYDRGVREAVARIDRRCFELERVTVRLLQAAARADTVAVRSLQEQREGTEWVC